MSITKKMEITNKLYKELYSRAMSYTYRNEDSAAECVSHLVLSMPKYSGATELQFWAFANTLLKNKARDLYKKFQEEKLTYIDEVNYDEAEIDVDEDFYFNRLKDRLTRDEIKYALEYIQSQDKKSNKEKLVFHRIKEKVLAESRQISYRYILVEIETGETKEFETIKDVSVYLGCTAENVMLAVRDGSRVQKKYFVKKLENKKS